MIPDPQRVADFIRETAMIDIMPRFQTLAAHEVIEKKPGDIVTIADREAEDRLTAMLSGLTPGTLVVGEEATHDDPDLLDRLDDDVPMWIIDPVDGTANFAAGRPLFAVMVAYIYKGETAGAWIYDPVRDLMAIAEHGDGAEINGGRLHLAPLDTGRKISGRVNFGSFPEERRPVLRQHFTETFALEKSMRCAGQEFLALLDGQMQFRLYNQLWAWDHAPGVLLLREAGGHAGLIRGAPYRPTTRVQALLCAHDELSWHRLRREMQID
ncbi:MAG: inositol monophosphatase [Proteobacteria bacterium]|nr:inositol monophosphatase [Pseudomonadota bacterium]